MAKQDPNIGKRVAGYRIVSKLGEGAMGVVYRATQMSLERDVALKFLPKKFVEKRPEFVERFLREARLAAKLTHPNIVQVYEAGSIKGVHFIAMELVKGESIADIIVRQGGLPESVALSIVAQAVQGLAAGEKLNMVHRDVKPENLLLTEDGIVKVADFGLAKVPGSDSMATHAGQVLGTPAFMSPEQAKGSPLDSRSDIYSLGSSLYQMITGRVPFKDADPLVILMMHIEQPFPDPRELQPSVSDFTCELIAKMTAKNPEERFQSFQELAQMLRAIPQITSVETEAAGVHVQPPVRSTSLVEKLNTTAGTLATPKARGKTGLLLASLAVMAVIAVLAGVLLLTGILGSGGDEGKGAQPNGQASLGLEISAPADGAYLRSREVEVRGKVTGDGASAVTVNGEPATLTEGAFARTVKLQEQGKQTITVSVEGPGGPAEKSIAVVVDTRLPVIRVQGVSQGATLFTNGDAYVLRGSVTDANLERIEVNGAATPFSDEGVFSCKVAIGADGATAIDIAAQDFAENRSKFSCRLVRDVEPPRVSLLSHENGVAWGKEEQEVRFRFSEPVSIVLVNGRNAYRHSDTVHSILLTLAEGENKLVLQAADRAGNKVARTLILRFSKQDPAVAKAAEQAWRALNEALQKAARPHNKAALAAAFLKEHGESRWADEARALYGAFRDLVARELSAYSKALAQSAEAPTPQGKVRPLRDFLEKFPASPKASDVKKRIASILAAALPLKVEGIELGEKPGFFRNRKDGASMVYVQPGRFTMGTDKGAPEEGPSVSCRLTGYYIYAHEVTNSQFAAFLTSLGKDADEFGSPMVFDSTKVMGGRFPWGLAKTDDTWAPVKGFEAHPVIFVTWYGAANYAAWAGGDLPTEARWERAARGTDGRAFPWGDPVPTDTLANLGKSHGRTTAVGALPAGRSPAGCLDMAGNVAEWCTDTYAADFLRQGVENKENPFRKGKGERTVRGGSWFHGVDFAKTTCRRLHLDPSGRFPTVGFRCVRD